MMEIAAILTIALALENGVLLTRHLRQRSRSRRMVIASRILQP